jgi:hypothetical protein
VNDGEDRLLEWPSNTPLEGERGSVKLHALPVDVDSGLQTLIHSSLKMKHSGYQGRYGCRGGNQLKILTPGIKYLLYSPTNRLLYIIYIQFSHDFKKLQNSFNFVSVSLNGPDLMTAVQNCSPKFHLFTVDS